MTFQMTFAIITPALIVGAFADRMKFSALVLFMSLWLLVVYAPIAHWVWGGGFLGGQGLLGLAAMSALGFVRPINRRQFFETETCAERPSVRPDGLPSCGPLVRLRQRG